MPAPSPPITTGEFDVDGVEVPPAFGSDTYGVMSYGGGLSPVAMDGAWATATHRVRVVLTGAPMAEDAYTVGDALNPITWTVTNDRTGAQLVVIGVEVVDETTVDLTLLDALGHHLIDHTVKFHGLLDFSGMPAVLPDTTSFVGVVQTMDPIDAVTTEVFRDRDLANPPLQIGSGSGYHGTLVVGSDRDYATEAGKPLLYKMIVRRLGTPKGSIRHLPRFGVGFKEKEPLPSRGDKQALVNDIEDQVKQEPDTRSVTTRLSVDRRGVLFVDVSVQASNGATLAIRMKSAGGRLVEI